MKIPTRLLESIEQSISINYPQLTQKQKLNFTQKSIELWLFIYNKQQSDINIKDLRMYVGIYQTELSKFRLNLNGKHIHNTDLLEVLKFANCIDINKKYSIGKYSKSYRINLDFLKDSNLTEIEIDFKKIFSNVNDKTFWLNKYPDMKIHIENSYKCKIDLDKYINWMYNNVGLELTPVLNNGRVNKRYLTYDRIYNNIFTCIKLNLGNIWFKVSDEGRLYSSITNLPYTSLPFIKLDNGNTIELDAPNSQPLLLTTLIDRFDNYKTDVENGIFYDKLATHLNIDKKISKLYTFKYILFNNDVLKSGNIFNALEILYPGLILEINKLKLKTELSKELQKIESNIFIKALSKLNIVFLVRHDSIVVEEKNKEIIEKIIISEYEKLSIKIKLKVK